MSQQQIMAAAQRAYKEGVSARYWISFNDWLKAQQANGRYWGIPQEGEN